MTRNAQTKRKNSRRFVYIMTSGKNTIARVNVEILTKTESNGLRAGMPRREAASSLAVLT
jgi:hypothetical protein